MNELKYRQSIIYFIIAIVVLEFINIDNTMFINIKELLLSLIFLTGYLFFYLGWRKRILLIQFFWSVFYSNLKFIKNGLVGIDSLDPYIEFQMSKITVICSAIGFVFIVLGIVKQDFKYISDRVDYPLNNLISYSILILFSGQIILRFIY